MYYVLDRGRRGSKSLCWICQLIYSLVREQNFC